MMMYQNFMVNATESYRKILTVDTSIFALVGAVVRAVCCNVNCRSSAANSMTDQTRNLARS